jgi:hypothetical protein
MDAHLETITFAWPADGRTTLAKIIHLKGGRIVGKEKSPQVKTFKYAEPPVHDLGSLYVAVKRAAAQGAVAFEASPRGRSAIVAFTAATMASSRTSRWSRGVGSGSIGTACRSSCSLAPIRSGHGSRTRCSSRGSAPGSRCGACHPCSAMPRASGK